MGVGEKMFWWNRISVLGKLFLIVEGSISVILIGGFSVFFRRLIWGLACRWETWDGNKLNVGIERNIVR